MGSGSGEDYATVAYDAATGARQWVKRYNGQGLSPVDRAFALGVSPDGSKLFVTGQSYGSASGHDYATIAYDTATGKRLWLARYNGPGNGTDLASALDVSPDGSKVFVTGRSIGSGSNFDYATVGYDAATGARLWVKRYNGPGHGDDFATALVVSLDGSTVFVTGNSAGVTSGQDYATVTYDATSGARQWLKRYNGTAGGDDIANAVGVSPDGSKLFVTGQSAGPTSGDDYATVAYDNATGSRLWVKPYDGPASGTDDAAALAVSADGAKLFVTGRSEGSGSDFDYATVAYSTG
jgi:hypothetical protein